ncbi:hypothetical protein C5D36_04380 [Rathayibacter sp. AY1C6]|nr:hypothetical protein C5D36_04380 [Rathayibacter sp. AY1C6]
MSAMLLPHPSFSTSRSKEIIDARSQVQALFAVSVGSRRRSARCSGTGRPPAAPSRSRCRTSAPCGRGLEDPDWHVRESLYTDPAAAGPPRE